MRALLLSLLLSLITLVACTSDVVLGSRACNALAGDACACATTADCPEQFHCLPQGSNTEGVCMPAENCTLANGQLDCAAPPMCNNNMMSCADNVHACCLADQVCYPAICLGCCE